MLLVQSALDNASHAHGPIKWSLGRGSSPRAWLALAPAAMLPVLVHPSATVSPSARLGAGTVILPHAVFNAAVRIGAGCIINSGAIVEHDCVIGDAVHVAPGAILLGNVEVGSESWKVRAPWCGPASPLARTAWWGWGP